MGSQNIHALCHGFLSDPEHYDGLVHAYAVYLVPCGKFLSLFYQALQLLIALRLNGIHNRVNTLPLGLAVVQEIAVLQIQLLKLFKLLCVISLPSHFSLHFSFLSRFSYFAVNSSLKAHLIVTYFRMDGNHFATLSKYALIFFLISSDFIDLGK